MSLAQWNLVQSRRAEEVADLITQATSELERWMETVALVWDKHNNNSETFLVSWWKANALEWPLLAVALSTSYLAVVRRSTLSVCSVAAVTNMASRGML